MKFGNLIKAALAVCVLGAGGAHAVPAYYFGNAPTANGSFPAGCPNTSNENCAPLAAKALFGDQLQGAISETFENRTTAPIGIGMPNGSINVLNNGGTLSQMGVPAGGSYLGGVMHNGGSVAGGPGRFNTTNGAATGGWFESDWSFTIELLDAVQAFGFYGTDFNDFAGTLNIRLLLSGSEQYADVFSGFNAATQSTAVDPATAQGGRDATPNGSLIFFGFTSDEKSFNQIQFTVNQSRNAPFGDWDYLGFDDIMVGNLRTPLPTPAPEPGSLALVGLALCAAGWARKTQRRA